MTKWNSFILQLLPLNCNPPLITIPWDKVFKKKGGDAQGKRERERTHTYTHERETRKDKVHTTPTHNPNTDKDTPLSLLVVVCVLQTQEANTDGECLKGVLFYFVNGSP